MVRTYRHVPSNAQVSATEWTGSNIEEIARLLGAHLHGVYEGRLFLSRDARGWGYSADPGEMVIVGLEEPITCDREIFEGNYVASAV